MDLEEHKEDLKEEDKLNKNNVRSRSYDFNADHDITEIFGNLYHFTFIFTFKHISSCNIYKFMH
mgnify:CR=1 FL=1